MTNFKGTKGPWILEENDIFKQNGELLSVAYGEGYGDNYQRTEATYANALLISKAPEMLEMLSRVIETFIPTIDSPLEQSQEDLLNNIEQLIKEATEL